VNHILTTFGKLAGSEILALWQRFFRQEKRCRKENPKAAARRNLFLKLTSKEAVMPIVKKAPDILTREVRMEEPVSALLDDYAQFIESSPDHVVNSVLKKTLWRDQDYRKWRNQRRSRTGEAPTTATDPGTTP